MAQSGEGKAKMQASEVPRAVAAAMSIASRLDLTVDDAIVLHDSNKLALRLLPCDVFARVAHVGHEVAQFEVELAQRLAETESPVAALEPRVEPRVYERDGFAVTLWTYYEPLSPSRGLASRLRRCARAAACRHAEARCHDAALHGSSRGGRTARHEPRPHAGARRRGPRASQPHATKLETSDRRPRRRRAVAARRAAPGQRAQHEERAAVHRPRDVLPRARRIRSRPCARRGQRALSGRRSRTARASAGTSFLRWSPRGAGIEATNSRTGNEQGENSSTPYARVHRTRRSTP